MAFQSEQKTGRLIYRIDNEARTVCSLTISQILENDRRARREFNQAQLNSEYDQLRSDLNQLVQFSREILESSLIQKPEFREEFSITSEVIKSFGVIRKELDLFEGYADRIADPNEVRSFFPFIKNELLRIDQKIGFFEQMDEYLHRLEDLWEAIEADSPDRTLKLIHLTQRILHDAKPDRSLYLSTIDYRNSLNHEADDSILLKKNLLIHSVHAARIGAWFSRISGMDEKDRELLVMAALLMETGKIRQIHALKNKKINLPEKLKELHLDHVSFSSAIAGGMGIHPVKLPELISLHHQREDGSGFPKMPFRKQHSKAASVLMILSRFTEVYVDLFMNHVKEQVNGSSLWCQAMNRVLKESEEGLFHQELASQLSKQLGFEWMSRDAQTLDMSRKYSYSEKQHIPEPKFLKRKRLKKQQRSS